MQRQTAHADGRPVAKSKEKIHKLLFLRLKVEALNLFDEKLIGLAVRLNLVLNLNAGTHGFGLNLVLKIENLIFLGDIDILTAL